MLLTLLRPPPQHEKLDTKCIERETTLCEREWAREFLPLNLVHLVPLLKRAKEFSRDRVKGGEEHREELKGPPKKIRHFVDWKGTETVGHFLPPPPASSLDPWTLEWQLFCRRTSPDKTTTSENKSVFFNIRRFVD